MSYGKDGEMPEARVVKEVPHVVQAALKCGVSYAAGWGDTEADPSFAILVVTGETAEKLKPTLDALRTLINNEVAR